MFAVDPEFVVPQLKMYVRCEDTVVVNSGGCDNLTMVRRWRLGRLNG